MHGKKGLLEHRRPKMNRDRKGAMKYHEVIPFMGG
jgi:hypothetical protein